MKSIYKTGILAAIVLISLAMHFKHFSKELTSIHVWRQTQTQTTIVNFYEEDFNILNPRINDRGEGDGIFRMEFPLMQWLVAGIYKIFGNHLVLTRIFMFITGLFSIFGIYKLLLEIFQKPGLAIIGAWAFNFSPCFYYYTINPLPDNFALCCSIWGIALFFNWKSKQNIYTLLFSGMLLSIGALCKLPFILYFIVPSTYFIIEIIKNGINKKSIVSLFCVTGFIILPLAWYISVVSQWRENGIVKGILNNQLPTSEILEYLKYNLVSALPELLLNYGSVLFFILGFYFLFKNKSYKNSLFPIFILWSFGILAYFIYEINMIAKVHDYYLFPFYPILFIIVSYGAYNLFNLKYKFSKYITVLLLLILPFTAYLRMQTRWSLEKPGFNKDLLTYKDELRSAVPKDVLCVAGNDESHYIFFYYIDKKGWGFNNDELNFVELKMMIDKGARYLYSDSPDINCNKEINSLFDKRVLSRGSINIYSLKRN